MPGPLRNIRLLIEYDGTAYHGWQEQRNVKTIEETLTNAVIKLTGDPIDFCVAGRTDAGVHALGQVANFYTHTTNHTWGIAAGINSYIPNDITVHEAKDVALSFNSKHDSIAKRYRYRIYQGPFVPALEQNRSWHIRNIIDIHKVEKAAKGLVGEHDFEAFRNTYCDAEHAIRTMYGITVERHERKPIGFHVDITFHANAYCRHMCRILTGTLVEIGLDKRPLADIEMLLQKKERALAGVTAPACGLTLLEVIYS